MRTGADRLNTESTTKTTYRGTDPTRRLWDSRSDAFVREQADRSNCSLWPSTATWRVADINQLAAGGAIKPHDEDHLDGWHWLWCGALI